MRVIARSLSRIQPAGSFRPLRELAGASLEVDPTTGALTGAEARKIRAEYGIEVRTDYSFAREGVFRLTDGRVLDEAALMGSR